MLLMMSGDENHHGLTDLGFSALESAVYAHLLRDGPSSAYRVARALGKPVANTYNAVEALHKKSAVAVVDDGETRLCRAVEPGELLAGMQRDFVERCDRAVRGLQELRRPQDDDRVYTLRSRAQVIARARQMLTSAKKCIVLDIFPALLRELLPDVQAAARRRVAVAAIVYEPVEIARVEIVMHARPKLSSELFPGGALAVGVDGCQHLLALFGDTPEELRQALWTQSVWLSVLQHNGLVCELLTQALDQALDGKRSFEDLRKLRERMRRVSVLVAPGLEKLLNRQLKDRSTAAKLDKRNGRRTKEKRPS
jgi:sugar-specific transcriptional regulator TrmB